MRRSTLSSTLAVATALVAGLIACGDGEDAEQPQASDVPARAVAVVGDAEISRADLARQVAAVRRAQPTSGKSSGQTRQSVQAQAKQQALAALLLEEALRQEAADRGIAVSRAEVRARWNAVAKNQFPTERALRRFLGQQTKQDLFDQLRVQMLTERINAQVAEQAGGGKKGAAAVAEFQKQFQERWAGRTACRDGQVAGLCSDN